MALAAQHRLVEDQEAGLSRSMGPMAGSATVVQGLMGNNRLSGSCQKILVAPGTEGVSLGREHQIAITAMRIVTRRAVTIHDRPVHHADIFPAGRIVMAVQTNIALSSCQQEGESRTMGVMAVQAPVEGRVVGMKEPCSVFNFLVAFETEGGIRDGRCFKGSALVRLVTGATVTFGKGRMGITPQHIVFRGEVGIVASGAGLVVHSGLEVADRIDSFMTPEADVDLSGNKNSGLIAAVGLVANAAVTVHERLVASRPVESFLDHRMAGQAGAARGAAPDERRVIGCMRVVAGVAIALSDGLVRESHLGARHLVGVTLGAQFRRGALQDQVLGKPVPLVAIKALVFVERFMYPGQLLELLHVLVAVETLTSFLGSQAWISARHGQQ